MKKHEKVQKEELIREGISMWNKLAMDDAETKNKFKQFEEHHKNKAKIDLKAMMMKKLSHQVKKEEKVHQHAHKA